MREGEQFANAYFDTAKKIEIAKALDEFGADYVSYPIQQQQTWLTIVLDRSNSQVQLLLSSQGWIVRRYANSV